METKTLMGVEVKSADQGIALVKFAAYNEVDHHNDVTVKGAFKDGKQVIVSSYNHASWGGSLPVGKGIIRNSADGKSAEAELQFFMNTQAGRETFETVKATGDLQQWSYGFNIEEEENGDFQGKSVRYLKNVDVYEISPVLLGAGKSTGTLAMKNKDGLMTIDKLKAAGFDDDEIIELFELKAKKNPKKDDDEEDGKKKPKKDDEDKESDDEDDEDDKKKPYRKKPKDSGKMRMSDHCIEVLASVKELADRAEEIVALRKADGKKGLAPETQVLLDLVSDQLNRFKTLGGESIDSVDEGLITRALKNLSEEL